MHGYNQGELFLIEAFNSNRYDVIHCQEHWLSSFNLNKLSSLTDKYVMFGESAMDGHIASGIVVGRPFGGVATFIRKSFAHRSKSILVRDRIVAVRICDSLFINVYFPCDDGSVFAYDLTVELLAEISNLLDYDMFSSVFIAGDFNTDLNLNRKHGVPIKNLLADYRIGFLDLKATENLNSFTFGKHKLNNYSIIDFICFSADLLPFVDIYS